MSKPKSPGNVRTGVVRMAAPAATSTSGRGIHQMDEAGFLLSSPANARRLRKAIVGLAAGEGGGGGGG